MTLLFAFLIGFFGGLRSLTAPAATAWAARLGWLKLKGPLALMGSVATAGIFTVLALGELAADKSSKIPDRTSGPPLVARIVLGALTGACVAAGGGEGALAGAALGALGGIVGCFGGFQARKRLVRTLKVPDLYIALLEDVVAVAGCVWIVSRFG
jgi:uncharacterized membrane protein